MRVAAQLARRTALSRIDLAASFVRRVLRASSPNAVRAAAKGRKAAKAVCRARVEREEGGARAGRFQGPATRGGLGVGRRESGQARGGASAHAEHVAHVTRDRGLRVLSRTSVENTRARRLK